MTLTFLDWAVIVGYLLLMLLLGLYFRRRSSGSTEEYFVSGRQVTLVAGGDVHGCHDLRGGYAAGGNRPGLHAGHRGELAVVEFSAVGDDDGLSVCAVVEALGIAYRCAVCGDALRGKTCGVSARFPRDLSGPADELPDFGLGDQGDDQHRRLDAGHQRNGAALRSASSS